MAGIGEASAIIAVAQFGLKLSKTIFEFAGEVKEAPKEIRRIGRDICTTSERLEEIGRLIDKNATTRLFSDGGIASAVRCSNDCEEIITEVSTLLSKRGWVSGSAALEKKDLDISLLEALRWPFVRSKLASPQADLEKIKASLSLLFNSAMANASSNPMQSEYALQIPRLKKWAEQATRRAENAKRQTLLTANGNGRTTQREVHWDDEKGIEDEEDAELRRKFVEYRVKLIKEEEERRAQEQAARIQAEKEAKEKAETEIRRKIEQEAVIRYKNEQDEMKARRSEREETFKKELEELGLETEKIQSIIETTAFQGSNWVSAHEDRSHPQRVEDSVDAPDARHDQDKSSSVAAPKLANGTRPTRPWMSRRSSKSQQLDHSPPEWLNGNGSNVDEDRNTDSTHNLELWLVDLISGQKMELAPSHEWLRLKLEKARHDEVSHKLAKLKHPWRTAIQEFMSSRNANEAPHLAWKLRFIGLPRRVSKVAIFGHRRGDCLVRLVLCQQRNAKTGLAHSGSNISDAFPPNQSDPETLSRTNKSMPLTGSRATSQLPRMVSGMNDDRPQQPSKRRVVSFTDGAESDTENGPSGIINIESEVIDGEISRGTTLIPSDLVPTSALDQLSLPWLSIPEGVDDDARQMLKIPRALAHEQVEELRRITKSMILDGEIPWRKPPSWQVNDSEIKYSYAKQAPGLDDELHTRVETTINTRENRGHDLVQGPNIPKVSSTISPPKPDTAGNNLMSRESSRNTEEIVIPRDSMNRIVRSEYDKNMDNDRENRSPPIIYNRKIEYFDTRARNDETFPPFEPIPPSLRRYSSRYDDQVLEPSPRYVSRQDDAYRGSQKRNGSLEWTGLARPQPEREEYVYRERERERERERPIFVEDRDEQIIVRRNSSPVRPRDRGRRDEEIIIRDFDRERSSNRDSYREARDDDIVIRDRERERPSYVERGDDRVVIKRYELGRPSRDDNEDVTIREVEKERPRIIEREEIIRRRDPSFDDPRSLEEGYGHRTISSPQRYPSREDFYSRSNTYEQPEKGALRYERRETGPVVLRNSQIRPRLPPLWEDRAERYDDRRIGSPSRHLNTSASSGRATSQRPLTNDHRTDADSDIGDTDNDIISSALRKFTTFNAETEDDMMSPDYPGISNVGPTNRSNLKQAQRRLDGLIAKQEQAKVDGDFITASDLQFYAIPDVRALVEELKVQDAQQGNGFKEAESDDGLVLSPVAASEEDLVGRDLQPRISEAKDSDTEGDAVSGTKEKQSPDSSKTFTEAHRKDSIDIADQAATEDEIILKKINGINSQSDIFVKRIVRRPTAVSVEDHISETSEDQRYHEGKKTEAGGMPSEVFSFVN